MANEFKGVNNKITIMGAISSVNLKKGETTDKKTNEKCNYISGKVTVKAGESRQIEVKAYAKEFNVTKEGEKKENKKYKSLLGLIDGTYPTMTTVSEEEATKVSIWGNGNFTPQFKDNFYKGSNGEMVESLEIDLGMGNFTIKEPHQVTPEQYKAEFEVTVFVHDVVEETNKEEQPTGRAKVQAYVPMYNGKVFPITLVAGKVVDQTGEEYDFGQDVLNGVQPQDTITFYGEIAFEQTEITVKRGGEGRSIGREVYDTKTVRVKELRVVGGTFIDDPDLMFQLEDIQEAVKQRKIEMENKKNEESEPKQTQQKVGFGGSKPLAPSTGAPKPTRVMPSF